MRPSHNQGLQALKKIINVDAQRGIVSVLRVPSCLVVQNLD